MNELFTTLSSLQSLSDPISLLTITPIQNVSMKLLKELTDRERDVLGILLKGRLDKEIADELGISVETIKKHNKNIYKKLDARNRSEVIALMSTLEINHFFRGYQRKHKPL